MTTTFTRASIALVSAAALTLAGCGKDTDAGDATEAATSAAAAASTAASSAKEAATSAASEASATASSAANSATGVFTSDNIMFKDAYVKAAYAKESPETDGMVGMTAIFGTIVNKSDETAHIVAFTDNTGAKSHEIHEVVNGKMQEKEGGLVIDADSEHVLKPGSDHLMLMGLTKDIKPGEKITVTLEFDNGDEVTYADIPVRDLAAGDEEYSSDHKMEGHDMDGEMKDGDHKMHADHEMDGDKMETDDNK
ncbi:copper chaperone PCu(A)C [Corynebacterium mendelii]|uniref:Copper chaperone PCu(A)C n=1 Tax=Corynebacterium mendelii TaxID=2765362 RepID=A0A939DYJ2_9CORY|nr:copper chaperone PCu(A)C [Corynebacterium mendelii]MBN9643363.1 copper chaperone PCu(A)C [Corynebacterium mendelii]